MLNAKDSESLSKAAQCSNLLVRDIRELVSADNPLLGEIAMELLNNAVAIEQKLQRLLVVTKP